MLAGSVVAAGPTWTESYVWGGRQRFGGGLVWKSSRYELVLRVGVVAQVGVQWGWARSQACDA